MIINEEEPWISPADYKGIFQNDLTMLSPFGFPPDLRSTAAGDGESTSVHAATASEFVLVGGTINTDGSGAQFDPVYHLITSASVPASNPSANTCLQFGNGSSTLSAYCFNVNLPSAASASGPPSQVFSVLVPWVSGTTQLSLVRGGKTLATLSAGTAPSVSISSPKSGNTLQGTSTLTWSGAVASANNGGYLVLYSFDGGNSWLPLSIDDTATQYSLDTTHIQGGQQVYFQVIGSTGLNSASAMVGPILIPQTPKIGTTANPVDFGNVLAGQVVETTVGITSIGSGPLKVSGLSVDNTSAFTVLSPIVNTAINVNAGSQQAIRLRLTTPPSGIASGHLIIASNDPLTPTLSVPLITHSAAAPSPSIAVPTNLLNFGTVAVGSTATQDLTVTNTGSADLTISGITSSDPVQFAVLGPFLPVTVSAQSQQNITLRFRPASAGSSSATLTIASNDPRGNVMVTLQGGAYTDPTAQTRTFTAHELTAFNGATNINYFIPPVLSRSGNRVAFATNDQSVWVVNTDGTGLVKLDTALTGQSVSSIDISSDGANVVWTGRDARVRLLATNGSSAKTLIQMNDILSTYAVRIAGDSSRILVVVNFDTSITGSNTPVQRGIYSIKPDGSGFTQVVSVSQIAGALGTTASQIHFVGDGTAPLFVISPDGSRMVFTVLSGVDYLLSSDGATVHFLAGPLQLTGATAISADGNTAAYYIRPQPFPTPSELVVSNFDGTSARVIAGDFSLDPYEAFALNSNGTQIMAGSATRLYNTDGSGFLFLDAADLALPWPIFGNGTYRGTMTPAGNRFAFFSKNSSNTFQLIVMDLNPASSGAAPALSNPFVSQNFAVVGGAGVTERVQVAATSSILDVSGVAIAPNGVQDGDTQPHGIPLYDDGTHGDGSAHDGVYTNSNGVYADSQAIAGARILRIKAEAQSADGKRHASMIDFQPFTVVTAAPCVPSFQPASPVFAPGTGITQSVSFSFTTNGCAWTAVANSSFISNVTPNGAENGTVNYTVAPNPGVARLGTLTIAGQAYNVIQAAGSADTMPPFGTFDTPLNNATGIAGAIAVTGWALDNVGVTRVDLYRNPVTGETGSFNGLVFVGTVSFVAGARPDVQAAYPTLPNANVAGWGYMLLTNFLPHSGGAAGPGNGTYTLHAFAFDAAGNYAELGAPGKTITVDNSHAAKPFGTIDTPGQGATISGNQFVNFGWVLTPGSAQVPLDGSTLQVYIDGVAQPGHPVYNQNRSDIASFFPGFTNSNGAIGYYMLDTTKLANGVHTIFWIAADNASRADGIGSRYFTAANSVTSTAPDDEQEIAPVETVTLRRGFNPAKEPESIRPDQDGILTIDVEELDRIELQIGAKKGYAHVNGWRELLPIGSTLQRGVFYWGIGPGFLGDHHLVFIRPDGTEARVTVRIKPRNH